MNVIIEKGRDDKNVPYCEIRLSPADPRDPLFEISFRKYPKHVFVGVTDNRENPSSGLDLEDCWIAPVVILQKKTHKEFDPYKAFMDALIFLGEIQHPSDPSEPDYDMDMWDDTYYSVEEKVNEWMNV